MSADLLSSALIQSMSRELSVSDLVRIAETLKQSGSPKEVESLYATWVRHNHDHPMLFAVLFNYSVVLTDCGKIELARDVLTQCIAINANFMPAYINLGRVYERLGNVPLAVTQWSLALNKMTAIDGTAISHKTTALNQSARALEAASSDEAAENLLRQSLEIDPRQREVIQHLIALRQRQCEWPVLEATERVSRLTLLEGMSPLSAAAFTDDPLLQLAMSWNYNRLDVGTPPQFMQSWPKANSHDGPLKIGYLSSDLREHAVGYLMTEVFGLHDRSKVEIFAYYCGIESRDSMHQKFQSDVDHWINISQLDDDSAARRIADDGIQILVDLNGYTRDARLKLVARRPAPVIVNWLGYPGTMASPNHHYIIADDWIIPPENELYYTEKVVRLPCYQPSNRNRPVAAKPTRAECGLPNDAMVYCCFNGTHKLTRFTFERWLMILSRVPGSVLWLLGSTQTADQRLRDYAVSRGIAAERLVFAQKLANPFHLARYELADLFLDTTPYGAHTTASDALWMGVPVLTLDGRSFAARVCGSLLRAAGISEMISPSAQDYFERAVKLGNNRDQLQLIREKLRAARGSCVLFDMPRLVRGLESLYEGMWQDFQAGRLPQPDLTNLDAYLEVGCQMTSEEMEVQSIKDYFGWWLEHLSRRHQYRPVLLDKRLVRTHGNRGAT